MRFGDVLWELLDSSLYVLHVIAVLVMSLAAVACPLWLGIIHKELVAIREQLKPCECKCGDERPCPVLPRVLPRLRRIGEEAED
jgi:hypothetical protein